MTEKEKMLLGENYNPFDDELQRIRTEAHNLSKLYNDTFEDEEGKRNEILSQLIPNMGKGTYLQGPIQFDYGVFSTFGAQCYANFNFTVLDCCPVTVGNNVLFGPNCTLATPMHPLCAEERCMQFNEDGTTYAVEYAKPIVIEDDCWLASNVTVCGGVTIGKGCVIGAGSVVTRDIPPYSLAAGVPCRVIRKITEADSVKLK